VLVQLIVPYVDQPVSFWKNLKMQFGQSIREVYFPVQHHCIGTGRPLQPSSNLFEFLSSEIFQTSVLVNPFVLPYPVDNLRDGIFATLRMLSDNFQVNSVSVANIHLARLIRKEFPHMKLIASVLMDVFTAQQAMLLNGIFDILVPASRILRNLQALQKIRLAFHGKIRLLVNESCIPGCLCRNQHFYEMANGEINFPRSLCDEIIASDPWLTLTGSWVLPQHLHLFEGIFDEIKLSGRVSLQNPEKYLNVVDSYINSKPLTPDNIGGGPASVPVPIEISEEFYRKTLNCENNCHTCALCRDYFEIEKKRINDKQLFHHS
jgi:hypothetical protein